MNTFTHAIDWWYFQFAAYFAPSGIGVDSLKEMNVDVVFSFGKLIDPEDLVGAGEKIDLWAVDIREEGLEQLKKYILQNYLW